MKLITETLEWQALAKHHRQLANARMQDWFNTDPKRFEKFSLKINGILFDYSKNLIKLETCQLLTQLAEAANLAEKIEDLFSGKIVNTTEKRPALHVALRQPLTTPLSVDGNDMTSLIADSRKKMGALVEKIHQGQWRGKTGKPIQTIVNLGIGGSHLGPCMATQALADFSQPNLTCHFVSNIDSTHLSDVLKKINPETTLFIISSKTFSTIETMTHAQTVKQWLQKKLAITDCAEHFIAVTAAPDRAEEFGISPDHIFPFWEWVGGRYSVWSAIGLPLAIMIGMDNFEQFLKGAYDVDIHFRHTPFLQNIPVLMALLGIWYSNFFSASTHAIIPYAHRLQLLRAYLQQVDMESNGKSVTHEGSITSYMTGPVIWGEQGCDGQHATHQLLHQGKHFIPIDFILVNQSRVEFPHHQDILMASCLSQAQALMQGKTSEQAYQELVAKGYNTHDALSLAPHRAIPGNRPSNILFLDDITPYHLGALLALYEHKVFVQGVIWNVNSFDQWGVELGKQLLNPILDHLTKANATLQQDSSTAGLIQHYKSLKTLKNKSS